LDLKGGVGRISCLGWWWDEDSVEWSEWEEIGEEKTEEYGIGEWG
jgi:hypothetical protein